MGSAKEIVDRMKQATKSRTYEELAQKLGVTLSTLNSWKQRDKVPEKNILKCAHDFNIDYQWLLTGKSKSQADKNTSLTPSDAIEVEVLSVRPGAGHGTELEAVDLFDTGERIVIDRSLLKTPPKGKLRAMQVDGYSMVPMLFPDSWVIIDESKEFRGDGLYVINVDNVLMVKLIEKNLSTGNLMVKSVNPDYDSWEVSADDQRVFEIYGKVVRCII